jgi:hypothetical protein
MREAHQIVVNDEVAFFKLHDLDKDNFWDEKELQSMYGLESDIDPNSNHIKRIIDSVYQEMDLNKDRLISIDEYMNAKLPSVPKNERKKEGKMLQKENNDSKHQEKARKMDTVSAKSNERTGQYEGVPNKFRA